MACAVSIYVEPHPEGIPPPHRRVPLGHRCLHSLSGLWRRARLSAEGEGYLRGLVSARIRLPRVEVMLEGCQLKDSGFCV